MIGGGLDRRMMHHVFSLAAMHGFQSIIVQGDPHAEPLYASMGLDRIGLTPSGSLSGRMLPVLSIKVAVPG